MLAYLDPSNNHRILDVTTTKIIATALQYLQDNGIVIKHNTKDLSFPEDNIQQYSNVKEAADAISIYAKGSGVLAYLSKASKQNMYPYLPKHFEFSLNNKEVSRFGTQVLAFGQDTLSYMINNKLLNAFLDALKNPEIFEIGFSGANANLIDVGLSLNNVSFEDILLLMNIPLIKEAFKNRTITHLMKLVEEVVVESGTNLDGSKAYTYAYTDLSITTDEILKAAKSNNTELMEIIKDHNNSDVQDEDISDYEEQSNSEITQDDSSQVDGDTEVDAKFKQLKDAKNVIS